VSYKFYVYISGMSQEKIVKSILSSAGGSATGTLLLIIYLIKKITGLTQTVAQLTHENEQLKSKLRLREAQLFGAKTETQASLEKTKLSSSTEASDKTHKLATNTPRKRGAQPGHKGTGRKVPQNLPVIEHIHQLPEDQQYCTICQSPLETTRMSDDSYEVDVQVVYQLVKHVRKIYKKTCNCPGPLVSAPAPLKIIPKSKFSINFWTKVLTDKFLMQLPIHRQVLLMKLNHLHVSKGTIISAFSQLSKYLLPLYEQFRQESQQERRHHADETRWKIFTEIDGKKGFNWWLWTFIGSKVAFYLVDKSRSARVPQAHLKFRMSLPGSKKNLKRPFLR
jgi:transposase